MPVIVSIPAPPKISFSVSTSDFLYFVWTARFPSKIGTHEISSFEVSETGETLATITANAGH